MLENNGQRRLFILAIIMAATMLIASTILSAGSIWYPGLVAILILLFAIQVLFAKRIDERKMRLEKMVWPFIALNLVIICAWPTTSTDIFSYIYQARIWSIHHLNPYLVAYNQIPSDHFYQLIANYWSNLRSPYGPIFLIIAGTITKIGSAGLPLTFLIMKLVFAAANIANALLIYKITRKPNSFYWYAFNPFILWEFSVSGHNDVLMITPLLLALLFFLRRWPRDDYKSVFFASVSALMKFMTAIILPPLLIGLIKEKKGWRLRIRAIAIFSAIFLATAIISYLPFLSEWKIIWDPITRQGTSSGSDSLVILLVKTVATVIGAKDPQFIGIVFGRSLFLLFYLGVLIKISITRTFTRENIIASCCWILGAFYACFFTWLMPWYFTTLIALLIIVSGLVEDRRYLWASNAITAYGILYYILLR